MTKAVNLVRPAAPIITLASRRAAPIKSALDTTDRDTIALHVAAENALSMALSMLRNPAGTVADLERATARACRAATLLKRACSAAQEGGAAWATATLPQSARSCDWFLIAPRLPTTCKSCAALSMSPAYCCWCSLMS